MPALVTVLVGSTHYVHLASEFEEHSQHLYR